MINQQTLSHLPETFGIYQYIDKSGRILYVGKAKNLKKRVKSYFRFKDNLPIPNPANSPRIQMMISQTFQIHTIIVSSEQDALLLENSLIKQLKPKYNILLRDDKTYPYIFIDLSKPFPRFEITRQLTQQHRDIRYYGPYPSGCREILDSLYDLCPLVQKSSCIKSKKACLFYQIKKCPAPCEQKITQEEYKNTIQKALELLENKPKLLSLLEAKMLNSSQALLFEEAQKYKERIQKIAPLVNFSQITSSKPYCLDVLAIITLNHSAILMKIFMRNGKISSSDYEILRHDFEITKTSVYTQYILNHYKDPIPIPPTEILLDEKLSKDEQMQLESFLSTHQNQAITLHTPQRGFKKSLLDIAKKNAEEILRQSLLKNKDHDLILEQIKNTFSLSQTPFRIEVFDTSHHSFTYKVGGMIVYENDKFIKTSYRHYHLDGNDEYSQMSEMLTRRIQSFEKTPPPSLWVLDGGKAQLNLAKKLLESSGVYIDLLAISKEKLDSKAHRAKGSAKDIIYTENSTHRLSPQDPRLLFFQKLRDEAHRFAISFHRKQKTSSISKNLPYSPAQIKRLLDFFGDFVTIRNTPEEKIKKFLKDKNH